MKARALPVPGPLIQPPARLTPVRELGRQLAANHGWTGQQWVCLHTLWARESQWDPTAQNPTSTAYGVAQFLDATWATVGSRKTSDPGEQIRAGLVYVSRRYGDPCAAWAAWSRRSPHWY